LTNTVLCLPPDTYVSESVTFVQKATNTRLEGLTALKAACQQWEEEFFPTPTTTDTTDDAHRFHLKRISMISPTTMIVQWNVTWVPPTAMWLESLAKVNRWTPVYCSYVHLYDQVSTFSYKAIAKLFGDAINTQTLRIPLACIDGTTTYDLKKNSDATKEGGMVVERITEELGYALDLKRGALQNRKCAQDLRLFLEDGRRMRIMADNRNNNWEDVVATTLPWSSVPGMNPLEVEPNNSEEAMVPVLFLSVTALTVLGFAAIVAPELIGQSLFMGSPTYIVRPEELNSIY
jgi:hypothetical protein